MIYIVCSEAKHLATADEQQDISQRLLREGLLREHDIRADQSEIIRNDWGKPFLRDRRDVYFSISHCLGGAALSISPFRTGIDIEKIRPFSPVTARKVLTDEELRTVMNSDTSERDFFVFWTLKESYTKAIGTGLSYPMKNIRFVVDRNRNMQCSMKGCLFGLFENNLGFVTAVCYLCREDHLEEKVEYCRLP